MSRPKKRSANLAGHSTSLSVEEEVWQALRGIADEMGAKLMVDMAHFAGLVATRHYPDPLPHADVVTTTTYKSLRGARGGMILSDVEGLAKSLDAHSHQLLHW